MKAGDKIYCHTDHFHRWLLNTIDYEEGKYYIIYSVTKDDINVISGDELGVWKFTKIEGEYYFYKFFYDVKQLRKLKLQKLNERI